MKETKEKPAGEATKAKSKVRETKVKPEAEVTKEKNKSEGD